MQESPATSVHWVYWFSILLLFGCSLFPLQGRAGLYWEVSEYPGQQFQHDFALSWDGAFAALDYACLQNDGQPSGTYSGSITQDSANTFPARKGGWCLVNTFIGLIEGAYYTAQLYCNGVARELFDNSACPDIVTPTANPNLGNCNCDGAQACVGNPIHIGNGNKYQQEPDYGGEGPFPLRFVRHYNSQDEKTANAAMGSHWRHTYQRAIHLVSATEIVIQRPDGKRFLWTDTGTGFGSVADRGSRLEATADGWEYNRSDDVVEVYDSAGVLQSISNPAGLTHTLVYQNGLLQTVTGPTGKSLEFIYDANGRVETLKVPGNREYHYSYDAANGNLTSVTYPTATAPNSVRTYHYAEAGFPHALTGITDERSILYATFEYDSLGRATASYHGPQSSVPAERIDGVTIEHEPAGLPGGSRELTNSRGFLSTYTTTNQNGVDLVLDVTGPGCSSCGAGNTAYVYDPGNNLLSRIDNGIITRYGNYDERGNYRCKVEGISDADTTPLDNETCLFDPVASPDARRVDYSYDPRFQRRFATITELSVYTSGQKVTTNDYDDHGNRTRVHIEGFRPDGTTVSRTTTYGYGGNGSPQCAQVPLRQLCSIDGPRTDVADITRFHYYPDESIQGDNRARLKEIEDANGMLIRSAIQYNASGKVAAEDRLNGLHLSYLYDSRDRLESLNESDGATSRTTRWSYLPSGEVASITQADGTPEATTLIFVYDDARRLTRIIDGLGNYIDYVLDSEGNKLESNVHDSTGLLRKQLTQSFDLYNRLDLSTQMNESVDWDYAPDGSLDQLTDGENAITDHSYDALKRLVGTVRDLGGSDPATRDNLTRYDYDVQGNLVSVTDPNNGVTFYQYDDLGNQLELNSPDSGLTTFFHDNAGNVIQSIDAKSQPFAYIYDVLNRLVLLDAPGLEDDIDYDYDNCTNGVGRLCGVTRGTATAAPTEAAYSYTAFGDLSAHQGVSYVYDRVERISRITYPSGGEITYRYNAAGKVDQVEHTHGSQTIILADNISYYPFGPIDTLDYGNGLSLNQVLDNAYRFVDISAGLVLDLIDAQYDANGNLLSRSNEGVTESFGFDALNRLELAAGDFGSRDYDYDSNGNRIWLNSDSGVSITTYAYEPNSNRLDAVDASDIQIDANGNTITQGNQSFSYTSTNRLLQVFENTSLVATYAYNGLGQRIAKTRANGDEVRYVYGTEEGLLAETDDAGRVLKEYVYLSGQLLAILDHGEQATVSVCPGDFDQDGDVDGLDLSVFSSDFGSIGCTVDAPCDGDIDGDGDVDGLDLSVFSRDFGRVDCLAEVAGPPEPLYVHADHLGSPRALTDGSGVRVWQASYDPFGSANVNQDPDGDGTVVIFNFRLPGQYYDSETGMHYNYFRTYDPSTGRYITSDPIGLYGGFNTYLYVTANPINYYDPQGLMGKGAGVRSYKDRRELGENIGDLIDPPDIGKGWGTSALPSDCLPAQFFLYQEWLCERYTGYKCANEPIKVWKKVITNSFGGRRPSGNCILLDQRPLSPTPRIICPKSNPGENTSRSSEGPVMESTND